MGGLLMGVAVGCTDAGQESGTEESAGGDSNAATSGSSGSSGASGNGTGGAREAGGPSGMGGAATGNDGGGTGGTTTMSREAGPIGPVVPAFWNASTMSDESLLFVQEAGQETATAKLLFVPETLGSIHGANGMKTFVLGKDLLWTPGSRDLTLTKDSTIPFKTAAEMHPPIGSPQSLPAADGKTALFFSEGHVFHDLQVQVTYDHADSWQGHKSTFAGANLPRTMQRLRQTQPLKIVVLGDSISQGYNASAFVNAPPHSPPYAELVAAALEEAYQSIVTVRNLAVAGTTSTWGLGKTGDLVAEKPDLAIIAFGMNDGAVQPFASNIQQIVSTVRQQAPDTEFILVATMAGNPEWTGGNAVFFRAGRDALAALGCRPEGINPRWRLDRRHGIAPEPLQ
jgi:acyl-CoA thioesterase-1